MKDKLLSFETARLAKEKGFDTYTQKVFVETLEHTLEMGRGGDCTFPYQAPRVLNSGKFDEWDIVHCKAPTQSLLQKWLREVHNIDAFVVACYIGEDKHRYSYYITNPLDTDSDGSESLTYEEALEEALYECLQIVPKTVA